MDTLSNNSNIERLIGELVGEVRRSHEFTRFTEASEKIKSNPEAWKRMNEFRARAYRVNNSPEHADPFEDMKDLMMERRAVRKDPVTDEYLTAEMELCRLLQHICVGVLETVDMNIDSFSDQI